MDPSGRSLWNLQSVQTGTVDASGNAANIVTSNYEYQPGSYDRMTQIARSNAAIPDTFAYDERGRGLIVAHKTAASSNAERFAYDAPGRLIGIATNALVQESDGFDAEGLLVSRTFSNGASGTDIARYYVDNDLTLVQRGAATVAFVHVISGKKRVASLYYSSATAAAQPIYYHRDRLGSIVGTSGTGAAAGVAYRYDIYGKQTIVVGDRGGHHRLGDRLCGCAETERRTPTLESSHVFASAPPLPTAGYGRSAPVYVRARRPRAVHRSQWSHGSLRVCGRRQNTLRHTWKGKRRGQQEVDRLRKQGPDRPSLGLDRSRGGGRDQVQFGSPRRKSGQYAWCADHRRNEGADRERGCPRPGESRSGRRADYRGGGQGRRHDRGNEGRRRACRLGGTTKLYRAVSEAEFADLAKSGMFRAGSNSMEGKWFAESAENAIKWGQSLEKNGFRVIEVEVPTSTADKFFRLERLDGIGPARYGELDQLNAGAIVREVK